MPPKARASKSARLAAAASAEEEEEKEREEEEEDEEPEEESEEEQDPEEEDDDDNIPAVARRLMLSDLDGEGDEDEPPAAKRRKAAKAKAKASGGGRKATTPAGGEKKTAGRGRAAAKQPADTGKPAASSAAGRKAKEAEWAAYMVTKSGVKRPAYDACMQCWETCKEANLEWEATVQKTNTDIEEKQRFMTMRNIRMGEAKRTFATEDVDNVEHHGCTVQVRAPLWTEAQIKQRCGVDASRLQAPWIQLWDHEGKAMKVLPVLDPTQPMYEMKWFFTKSNRMSKSESSAATQLRAEQGKEVFTKLNKEMAKKGCNPTSLLTLEKIDQLAEIAKQQDLQAMLADEGLRAPKRPRDEVDEDEEGDDDEDDEDEAGAQLEVGGQAKGVGKGKGKKAKAQPKRAAAKKTGGASLLNGGLTRTPTAAARARSVRSDPDSMSKMGDDIEDLCGTDGMETAQRWVDRLDIDKILSGELQHPRIQLHHANRCRGTFQKHKKLSAKAVLNEHVVIVESAIELMDNLQKLSPATRLKSLTTLVQNNYSVPQSLYLPILRLLGLEAMENNNVTDAITLCRPFANGGVLESTADVDILKPMGSRVAAALFSLSPSNDAETIAANATSFATMMHDVFVGDFLLSNIAMKDSLAEQQLTMSKEIAQAFDVDPENIQQLPDSIFVMSNQIKTAHKTMVALLDPLPLEDLSEYVEATFSDKDKRSPLKILASVLGDPKNDFYNTRYRDYGRYAISLAEMMPRISKTMKTLEAKPGDANAISLGLVLMPEVQEKCRPGGGASLEKTIFQAVRYRCDTLQSEMDPNKTPNGKTRMPPRELSEYADQTKGFITKFSNLATDESTMTDLHELSQDLDKHVGKAKKDFDLQSFSDACKAVLEASGGVDDPLAQKITDATKVVEKSKGPLPAKQSMEGMEACRHLLKSVASKFDTDEFKLASTLARAAEGLAKLLCIADKSCDVMRSGCELLMLGAKSVESNEQMGDLSKKPRTSKDARKIIDEAADIVNKYDIAKSLAEKDKENDAQCFAALATACSIMPRAFDEASEHVAKLRTVLEEHRGKVVRESLAKLQGIHNELEKIAGGIEDKKLWKEGLDEKCKWVDLRSAATGDGGLLKTSAGTALTDTFKKAKEARSAYEKSCVDAGVQADNAFLTQLSGTMDLAKVTHIEVGLMRALVEMKDAEELKTTISSIFLDMVKSKVALASVHPVLLNKAQKLTKV